MIVLLAIFGAVAVLILFLVVIAAGRLGRISDRDSEKAYRK